MSMAAAGQSRNQVEVGKEESHRLNGVYRQKMPPAWLGHRPHVVLGRKLHHSVQHESWVGVGFSVRQTKTCVAWILEGSNRKGCFADPSK